MKLATRSRIAIAATVLATGALLTPAAPAAAEPCYLDSCDIVTEYYSDASLTTIVGEHEDGVCGYTDWGVQTPYWRTYQDRC
jgi:hypothetical protein